MLTAGTSVRACVVNLVPIAARSPKYMTRQGCSAKLRLPTRAVGRSIDEGGRNVKRLQLDREVMIQVDNSAAEAEVEGRQPDVKARVEQSTTQ